MSNPSSVVPLTEANNTTDSTADLVLAVADGSDAVASAITEAANAAAQTVYIVQESAPIDYLLTFLSPAAILAGACFAIHMARKTIESQKKIAKQRMTIDLILRQETDPAHQMAAATFRDVRDSGKLNSLLSPTSAGDKNELLQVQIFLNHYEAVCIGMRDGAADELYYFKMHRGSVVHHWHGSKIFIKKARDASGNDQIYANLQRFAEAWDKDNGKQEFVTRDDDPAVHLKKPNDIVLQKEDNQDESKTGN